MDNYIKYSSTRGGDDSLSYEEVLLSGLARDGGLFMPEKWPSFSHVDLKNMKELSYSKLASKILKPFIRPFLDENDISTALNSLTSDLETSERLDIGFDWLSVMYLCINASFQ